MRPKGNEASSTFGALRGATTFEIGLGKSLSYSGMTSTGKVSAKRAKELAGKTIERLGERAASGEENATRKRQLIKGVSTVARERQDRRQAFTVGIYNRGRSKAGPCFFSSQVFGC